MSSPSDLPQTGDVVADKYRVERLLGKGGMGAVFSAVHELTGKRVALKWILPGREQSAETLTRFLGEARASARVQHPNLVDVFDVGEHQGSLFLVMEYLEGQPLSDRLEQEGALDAGETIRTLLPAMRGVEAAHEQGIVHRDLKPDNIFLCGGADGRLRSVKVLDFGISKLGGDGDFQPQSLTRSGVVMGTPSYMPPEQLTDAKTADHRSDIYAWGVILYHALTGVRPYRGGSFPELALAIVEGGAPPASAHRRDLPPALVDVIARAMATDRGARFQSMGELIEALTPFASKAQLTVRPSDPSFRPPTADTPMSTVSQVAAPAARSRRGWLFALLAAAAAIPLLVWLLRPAAPAPAAAAGEPPQAPAAAAAPPTPPAPPPAPPVAPAPAAAAAAHPDAGPPTAQAPAPERRRTAKRRTARARSSAQPATRAAAEPPAPEPTPTPTATAQPPPPPSPEPAGTPAPSASQGRLGIEMSDDDF